MGRLWSTWATQDMMELKLASIFPAWWEYRLTKFMEGCALFNQIKIFLWIIAKKGPTFSYLIDYGKNKLKNIFAYLYTEKSHLLILFNNVKYKTTQCIQFWHHNFKKLLFLQVNNNIFTISHSHVRDSLIIYLKIIS